MLQKFTAENVSYLIKEQIKVLRLELFPYAYLNVEGEDDLYTVHLDGLYFNDLKILTKLKTLNSYKLNSPKVFL